MNYRGNFVQDIITTLRTSSQFNDINFVLAYENEIKPTPLKKPLVVLSVKSCEIGPKISFVNESGETTETNSRNMNTTLGVDIYLPYSSGGNEGHKIFDRIAAYLIFTKNYKISKAVCDNVNYDLDSQAITLQAYFIFYATIS